MSPTMSWRGLIGALIRRESLSSEQATWAMNEIMEGNATPVQVAGFGVALRMKGETAAELAGLSEVMLRRATPISVPGPLVDLVGTGGDGAHTVNISTMGAIVAAGAGARVVKHGNRAASSACGAADVLEALGVSHRPAAGGHRPAGGGNRDRVPVRAALPSVLPARVGRAQRAGGADRLQLPRPGIEPGPARGPGGGGVRPSDGRGDRRRAGRPGLLRAGVPRRRRAGRAHHDDHVHRLGGARRHGGPGRVRPGGAGAGPGQRWRPARR